MTTPLAEAIGTLRSLESLDLYCSTDEQFELALANKPQMNHLNLFHSGVITSRKAEAIAACSSLRSLNLEGCSIREAVVSGALTKVFENNPFLETVNLITKEGVYEEIVSLIEGLKTLRSLTTLKFSLANHNRDITPLMERISTAIAGICTLRSLHLQDSYLSVELLQNMLPEETEIESLSFKRSPFDSVNFGVENFMLVMADTASLKTLFLPQTKYSGIDGCRETQLEWFHLEVLIEERPDIDLTSYHRND